MGSSRKPAECMDTLRRFAIANHRSMEPSVDWLVVCPSYCGDVGMDLVESEGVSASRLDPELGLKGGPWRASLAKSKRDPDSEASQPRYPRTEHHYRIGQFVTDIWFD